MHATAELVRSVLRWSLTVVSHEESVRGKIPGPRMSQICLGNMMSRTDPVTAAAIAREIAEIEKAAVTDIYMSSLVACIRASWGQSTSGKTRRTGDEDTVMVASRAVSALNRFGNSADRDFVRTCCLTKTWKQTEHLMPGRIWSSIRDDFEKLARRFYLKESHTVCVTAEFITRLSKR